jgi:hypothetical protein
MLLISAAPIRSRRRSVASMALKRARRASLSLSAFTVSSGEWVHHATQMLGASTNDHPASNESDDCTEILLYFDGMFSFAVSAVNDHFSFRIARSRCRRNKLPQNVRCVKEVLHPLSGISAERGHEAACKPHGVRRWWNFAVGSNREVP